MRIIVIFFAFIFTIHYSSLAKNTLVGLDGNCNLPDTTKLINDSIDVTIDEVINSRTIPKSEKVHYVNEVTKYGFKNLFKNFSYNSSMPYSSQVNPYAERYMQDYLQGHGSYLQKMKGTSQLYFNLIDNILGQYGLPKELKYLAVIESDLKPQALSWVGARGPWQFMTYTARDYGLKVKGYIDERTDYYKSTNAAARYLLSLYKDLKDWLLVIAAYNGGPARVYSAIKKSGSRNFWSLQYYLPAESRNHVKKFIATHYIMEGISSGSSNFNYTSLSTLNDPATPGLSENEKSGTETLAISGKYSSLVIAKNLVLDIKEFNRLNPGFDAALAGGNEYNIRLTPMKMDFFVANKYAILNECVEVLLNDVNEPAKTTYTQYSGKPLFKRK
ncbi:MAG: lytic transglycosylase domain-containing protein [Ginsengibacter sp.]